MHIRKHLYILMTFLCLCQYSFGQDIKLDAPSTIFTSKKSKLIVVVATVTFPNNNVVDKKNRWGVWWNGVRLSANEDYVVWPDGSQILLTSGEETGVFLIDFGVEFLSGDKKQINLDGKPAEILMNYKLDYAETQKEITIKDPIDSVPKPPSPPNPPNPPNPTPQTSIIFGLDRIAYDGAISYVKNAKQTSSQLAKSYRDVANQINNAQNQYNYKEIGNLIRLANARALGSNLSIWEEWGKFTGNSIYQLFMSGRIKNNRDWVQICNEIAIGLERVKNYTGYLQ